MSASIKEVALKAGVSVATVSRVINGTGPVAQETRARIQDAIDKLRYVPHGAARSLITNQTDTVGVLLPDLYGEFFSEVIRGVDLAARRNAYHVLVSGFHSDRAEIEAVLRALRGRVDGLIVLSPDVDAQSLRRNLPDSLPVVLLNTPGDGTTFDAIQIDNYGGARDMVRHLAGLGHSRIAFVRGPEENEDARERLRGYRDALRTLGLEASPALEIAGDFSEDSGYRAGRELLEMQPRPTAVFAANDSMAIGCLFALREAGVAVPEGIALAGFDDIPISRYLSPPLSSVHVPIAELGMRAMERLLHAVDQKNEHERRQETVPATLVVRGSCGGAAAAGIVLAMDLSIESSKESKGSQSPTGEEP